LRSRKARTTPHPARFCAGERSRVRSATGRHVFICRAHMFFRSPGGKCAGRVSSRSIPLRRSFHKAPGPRFRDPADFLRSPLSAFGAPRFSNAGVSACAPGSPFQPSKAAAHSGRGRLPKASPGYGCEPRPEAPAVSRNSNASRCALDGNDKRNIVLVIRKVKRISFIVIAGLDPAIHTAEMPGGWLYILASRPRGTLYVGVTNNLVRRMDEHRSGMNELLLGTASTIWCSSNNTRLCRWRSSVRRTSSTGRAIGRFS
jgi:hypothetical protein